ncbi:ABC transporter substrate-binding protein [Pseudonocardia kujensis]|uniref:ABC transporter substrate-binding protein n=1 Tax=Pseudonocardia kujensis TaxID=1128675 RepID=UPI001E4943A8|nr:ABC transporter substrate-binding protein [Pseudonocardia kujensis]MCE0767617.1 ABC transporter substrate-binding protein [Pseudonocardia kujensis]
MTPTSARHRLTRIALAAGLAVTLSACSTGASGGGADATGVTADTIALGTSLPLSGPAGTVCRPVNDAAAAWFKHVNDTGGIHGRKIELTVLDDQYLAPQALTNARELVRKPVLAIFGGCGTIQPPAIQSVAEPAGVPFLFPTASVPDLSSASNAFLALPSYDQQMNALTDYSMQTFGPGSVYILAQQLPGVDDITAAVTRAATAHGAQVLGTDITTAGQADFAPAILKIKQAAPDYLVVIQGTDGARVLDGIAKQGALPKKKILGFSAILTQGVLETSKALPPGMLVAASGVDTPNSPGMKTCRDVMDQVAPTLAEDINATFACAAAQAMTSALDAAGPQPTRQALTDALLSWKDFPASPAFRPMTFTADQRVGQREIFGVTVSDGSLDKLATIALPGSGS